MPPKTPKTVKRISAFLALFFCVVQIGLPGLHLPSRVMAACLGLPATGCRTAHNPPLRSVYRGALPHFSASCTPHCFARQPQAPGSPHAARQKVVPVPIPAVPIRRAALKRLRPFCRRWCAFFFRHHIAFPFLRSALFCFVVHATCAFSATGWWKQNVRPLGLCCCQPSTYTP